MTAGAAAAALGLITASDLARTVSIPGGIGGVIIGVATGFGDGVWLTHPMSKISGRSNVANFFIR